MKKTIVVLVTGLGGPLGVSVLKALKMSSLPLRILGSDADPRSFGLYLADKSFVFPRADTQTREYIDRLLRLVNEEKIDVVFPCSEGEMFVLAENAPEFNKTRCFINVASLPVLEKVMDKFLFAKDLDAAGLPAPDSVIPDSTDFEDFVSRHGFPLIIKGRLDSGSRHFYRIYNRPQLDFFCSYIRKPIVQELLLPDEEEYTVGVFVAPEGRGEGTIILRRQLAAGLTFKAEVIENCDISNVCLAVVKHFGLTGANNVQLRLTNQGPKIFELNARFSSSTVIRAYFGFNEPELVLRSQILGEKVIPNAATSGLALRMWDEIYVERTTADAFELSSFGENMTFNYGVSLPNIRK